MSRADDVLAEMDSVDDILAASEGDPSLTTFLLTEYARKLEAERDEAVARVRLQSVETARNAQRLSRLRAVARDAEQHLDLREHTFGCDCTECCLRSALSQLEEGDV